MTKEMEHAFDFIDSLDGIGEGSKAKYKGAIRKIVEYSKKNFYDSVNNVSAYKYIGYDMKNKKGEYILNTSYTVIDALCGFLSKYKVVYHKLVDSKSLNELVKIRTDLSLKRKTQVYSQEIRTDITLDDLYILFDSYNPLSLEYLYLAFNLLMPPRRSEYIHCKFVVELPKYPNKEINYIVMGGTFVRLVFYKYKEKVLKVLGTWDRELKNENFSYLPFTNKFSRINPEQLGTVIRNYYNVKGDLANEQQYIFPQAISSFDNFISKTLKKNNDTMKQTFIRNITINAFLKNNMNALIKKDFAYDCGQSSLETQMLYADHIAEESDEESIEESSSQEEFDDNENEIVEVVNSCIRDNIAAKIKNTQEKLNIMKKQCDEISFLLESQKTHLESYNLLYSMYN